MYFAHMYCYGYDLNDVGITGILGCMGVAYKGESALYAVHIPDNNPQANAKGGRIFAKFVRQYDNYKKGKGELFVFVNGKNRTTAEDEARALKGLLNARRANVYRIMQNLGPGSGGFSAPSASIMVRNNGNLALLYKHVPDDQYIQGGRGPVGQYQANSGFLGNVVPSDWADPQGWYTMNGTNCNITKA